MATGQGQGNTGQDNTQAACQDQEPPPLDQRIGNTRLRFIGRQKPVMTVKLRLEPGEITGQIAVFTRQQQTVIDPTAGLDHP